MSEMRYPQPGAFLPVELAEERDLQAADSDGQRGPDKKPRKTKQTTTNKKRKQVEIGKGFACETFLIYRAALGDQRLGIEARCRPQRRNRECI
jgi:hypothetical protein